MNRKSDERTGQFFGNIAGEVLVEHHYDSDHKLGPLIEMFKSFLTTGEMPNCRDWPVS